MDASTLWSFLLVFVRISSFMVVVPVFSGRQIPATYKIGFSAALAILCVGLVKEPIDTLPQWALLLLILKEFLVGIVLGMTAALLLYSVQFAGSLLDMQIGFSMASLFDPNFGLSEPLTGRFKNILAMLLLFSTNGHLLLIQGILASFDWISLQDTIPAFIDGRLSAFLLECVKQMFMIGFMMAAPILGAMFVCDVALGILAKTVPQLNIISVAPPLKILLHFALYIVLLPGFIYLLNILFENMFGSMSSILKIMGA
ncbi:flagellar biosynthetic protein FliR [Neobacillus sp. OS1-2]|uniref:flagellar biosynthetic protein FliR n=1 Tax=Neobacillus sp. OS1-2 TaxID=3070680 RepID=UPI0027DFC5FC|nr:flagellar biosynthetic protein FliR [Neobacillus sp. OS1-2]WML39398.1 flagellar biosynthetic protein FliR [Neobacillus sp. OS1-2]